MPDASGAVTGKRISVGRVVPAIPHALTAKAQARRRPQTASSASSSSRTEIGAHSAAKKETGDGASLGAKIASEEAKADVKPDGPPAADAERPALTARKEPQAEYDAVDAADAAQDPPESIDTAKPSPTPTSTLKPAVRELPPSFVPSNFRQPGETSVPGAEAPAGADRVILGGSEASAASSSPAPALRGDPQAVPFAPHGPSQPTFVPSGHGYHLSEPFAGQHLHTFIPAFNHTQQPMLGSAHLHSPSRSTFQSHSGQHRHQPRHFASFRPSPYFVPSRPYDDSRTPIRSDFLTNDRSATDHNFHYGLYPPPQSAFPALYSQSQAPTDPAIAALRLTDDEDSAPSPDDAVSLSRFIRGHFGSHEFADHVLHISHEAPIFPPIMIPAHGLVLARSLKMRSLMAMNNPGHPTHPKHLAISVSDHFINHPVAVTKTVARLYGEPLLTLDFLRHLFSPGPANREEQMQFSLAYAAAGHFFQLEDVISRGLDLAVDLLAWDTLSKPLAFALEGGLSPSWTRSEQPLTEDRGSSSSADEVPSRADTPTSAPAYGIYSDRLVSAVVEYVIRSIPSGFSLSASAAQLRDVPRLPPAAEARRSHHARSDSRLSQIRFGEMGPDDRASAAAGAAADAGNPAHGITSAVLLSLPFALLKHILEHPVLIGRLGTAAAAGLAESIVAEREARRQRFLVQQGSEAGGAAATVLPEDRLWLNARWVERVESRQDGSGAAVLMRQQAGPHTPTSSATSAKS